VIAILVSFTLSAVVCPCAYATSGWSKTYGGTGNETARGETVQTSDGGFAISGDTNSSGAGGMDFWLVKADAAGNLQWNMTYGGTGTENGSALLQTSDGGYVLTGSTDSVGAGGTDIWLVKTDEDGVVPEGLTIGVMLLLSTVAAIVGIRILQKRPKWKNG
jgi:predicted secreted protein